MTRAHTLLAVSAVFSVCIEPALAQEKSSQREGGPELTFGITSTVSATDNQSLRPAGDDSATMFDMGLSFSYIERRPTDVLSFVLDGGNIEPTEANGHIVGNQRALVAYDREGANSALSLGAEYNFASVDDLEPFDNERASQDGQIDENDLIQDQGDRQKISARFSYTTGLNDPIELTLEGRYRDQSYQDTTNPDLFDTEAFNLAGTTLLRINPVTEARLVLRYEGYQAEDAARTHRRTSSLNVGFAQEISSIDNLDVSLGLQNIETENTILGMRQSEDESSLIGSLRFTRELPRGTIGTTLDLKASANGRTATWRVNRALLLPRGELDLSFGVTNDVDGALQPVGSVNFLHEMQRSTLSASLSRKVTTSTQSNELLTTQASLGYEYEINSLSNLDFSVNYVALNQAGGPAVNDTARANFRAAYSRDLTRNWELSSGYEYRMREETGMGTAKSNRVFITLQREFTAHP